MRGPGFFRINPVLAAIIKQSLPKEPGAYLNSSWQAFILSKWVYHFYRLENLYKYRLLELLFFHNKSRKTSQNIVDEVYEEIFGTQKKTSEDGEQGEVTQERINELIEYYKSVFEN